MSAVKPLAKPCTIVCARFTPMATSLPADFLAFTVQQSRNVPTILVPCPLLQSSGQTKAKQGLPPAPGYERRPTLQYRPKIKGTETLLGAAAAGDFPDSPEDGWATALAYREHVLRVVQRLRKDPDAAVEVAEVEKGGWRLRPWTPGDESVRPGVLAAIRAALEVKQARGKALE